MSAAVAEPPFTPAVAAPPPRPASPVEYVRGLSPADKEAVFFALLAEARALGEDAGTLPVDDPGGRRIGYFLTPEAWERLRQLPPSALSVEEFERRANASPDELLTADEMLAVLDPAAAAPTR